MGWVPFAATVGGWLGGSAALGGTAIVATAATAASAINSASAANSAKKSAKGAAEQAQRDNDAAIAKVKAAQATASNRASGAIARRKRNTSQSIFTSPLGLSTQAETAKKALLGS